MKVAIYTLGCKVNQYESEAILELLEKEGFESAEDHADVAVINTCTVTAESARKARQTVRRAARENPGCYLLVMGCASQIEAESFRKIDGVSYITGNRNKNEVVARILEYAKTGTPVCGCEIADLSRVGYEKMAVARSERTRAYIKIEDGCESKCAYCIIPRARGKIVSRPLHECMEEAKRLVAAGYKELVLTGIEVSAYGSDLDGVDLSDLVTAMHEIKGLTRVRLSSIDPSYLRPEVTDKLFSVPTTAPHFHLSLQSGSDGVLHRMRRRYNTAQVERNIAHMRLCRPDVHFTADIIVGFPGETEEEFEETCRFLEKLELLHVHVFAYSPRPGTEAAGMKEQIPENIKSARSARLIALCSEICKRELDKQIGREYDVLFENRKDGKMVGHTANFIEVAVESETDLHGQILPVRITSREGELACGEIIS